MTQLLATYFDGKTSGSKNVQVQILEGSIVILGDAPQPYRRDQIRIVSPMSYCPLVIELYDGGRLEIDPKNYQFDQVKSLISSQGKLLNWFEANYFGALSCLVFVVVGIALIVQLVLPIFSETVAAKVPQKWANTLDKTIVEQLDGRYFTPTELPNERQEELLSYFKKNIKPMPQILFRELDVPNAFALAGNTIIISDKLVASMEKDEEILAVALHEMAHLKKRHVLSMLISSSALSVLSFVIIGDMVGTTEWILNMGVFLISAKYSRSFEQQADQLALESLYRLNLSATCFKDALLNLQKAYSALKIKQLGVFDYLSSHPGIDERVEKINGPDCK